MVKLTINNQTLHTAAEGEGPVNALDNTLRKALLEVYPDLSSMHLTDYKVRVLDGNVGTSAKVRVLIDSANEHYKWTTVGVSENIIEASWQALVDSINYLLMKTKSNKS
jgi:2-isopropylmalate synthase